MFNLIGIPDLISAALVVACIFVWVALLIR